MSQKPFQFKQFLIEQDRCAMKIGSDAVLLGSCIEANPNMKQALEIGSGTGVISLMLAQRYSNLEIEAIEIDTDAYEQSLDNIRNSPFASRIQVKNHDFLEFSPSTQYDLVFSNPPYFHQSLKSGSKTRDLARHMDQEQLILWIDKVASLMNQDASLWMILPFTSFEKLQLQTLALHLHTMIEVQSFPESDVIRVILEYKKQAKPEAPKAHKFWIYEKEKVYSDTYRNLMKDFLTIF